MQFYGKKTLSETVGKFRTSWSFCNEAALFYVRLIWENNNMWDDLKSKKKKKSKKEGLEDEQQHTQQK